MPKQSKELYKRGDIWWFRYTHPHSRVQIRRSAGTKNKNTARYMLDQHKAAAWLEVNL